MILSAKVRKCILAVPYAREICNLIVNCQNKYFYFKLNKAFGYDKKILAMKNCKKGKRCFIVGNGPSLSIEQLSMIKKEDCFGANRIYKIFEKTDWRPKYYVIQDKYDMTKGIYDFLDLQNLFVADIYWREHGMKNPRAICYHTKRNLRQSEKIPYSEDAAKYIQVASTVTYTMIQLATYMGYSKIYLLGMDHSYANITNDKGEIIKKNNIKSHVFNDEKPEEVVANIAYMELAYKSAKKYCEAHNILIHNATNGGALEVFERTRLSELF